MRRKTKEEIIETCNRVHGDAYSYDKMIYISMDEKIVICCNKHGDFVQTVRNHIHLKHGCPKCANERMSSRFSYNRDDFVKKASIIHKNIYNYDRVIYKTSHDNVKIVCDKHGEFEQRPDHHLSGSNCPKCMGKYKTTDEFVDASNDIHDGIYSYDKCEYKNSRAKVIITCKEHGDFAQTPNNHLLGKGCPACISSKGETKIRKWLDNKNIQYKQEMSFPKCKFIGLLYYDFYIEKLNVLIEFDGKQHFEAVDYFGGVEQFELTKHKDELKNRFAKDNDITLLRIPYTEYHNISSILENNLKGDVR